MIICAVFTEGEFNVIIKLQKGWYGGCFMKKSNFKKAFALSALMAFVITGSAYAKIIKVDEGQTKNDTSVIELGQNDIFENAGTVNATESITVNGGAFYYTAVLLITPVIFKPVL